MNLTDVTLKIKAEALRLGFSACGVSKAAPVDTATYNLFHQWIKQQFQADMSYLERNIDKRCDPRLLVEGVQSIISVALNYYPKTFLTENQLQFAAYAYGRDYHNLIKRKLQTLLAYIQTLTLTEGRVFCDTAPVLERYWAQQSGLGWIGKNTQLIIPHAGSFFFLGEIFITRDLVYDKPMKEHCGTCKRCLEACPAQAIISPHQLDANKCLSYQTIENRGVLSPQTLQVIKNRVYGCDECQKSCPWNRFAYANDEPDLQPSDAFMKMETENWEQLTIEQYRTLFKDSAVKRAKYEGLIRNIKATKD